MNPLCGPHLINQSLTSVCAAGDRAEGAEGDLDNAPASNNNSSSSSSSTSTSNTKKSFSLEARFSFLNLRRPRADNTKTAEAGQTVVLVK